MRWLLPLTVLVIFGSASIWLCFEEGYFGFIHLALRERWGLQVLVDLTIALVLLMPHLIRDARARGIPAWPFVVTTVFLGSMGPLAYAVVRGWRARPGHAAARVPTPAT